jgi:hypothetical protein
MNHTIKKALNKYDINEYPIEDQMLVLCLVSSHDIEVRAAIRNSVQLRKYLKRLKGMGICEAQYATA